MILWSKRVSSSDKSYSYTADGIEHAGDIYTTGLSNKVTCDKNQLKIFHRFGGDLSETEYALVRNQDGSFTFSLSLLNLPSYSTHSCLLEFVP